MKYFSFDELAFVSQRVPTPPVAQRCEQAQSPAALRPLLFCGSLQPLPALRPPAGGRNV